MKNDILKKLMPYGYGDIARCNDILDASGITDDELADALRTHYDGTPEESVLDADIVGFLYQYILDRVADELYQDTGVVLTGVDSPIEVSPNYLATTYNAPDATREQALKWLKEIKEPTATVLWFIEQIQN